MSIFKPEIVLSIRAKLTLLLIAIALGPLLILNRMSFSASEQALKSSTLSGLNMSAEYKAGQVYLYLETLKTNTRDFSSDGFIKRSLENLSNNKSALEPLVRHLRENKLPIHDDLLFIDLLDNHGNIVASTRSRRIGMPQSNQDYFQQGHNKIYVSNVSYNADEQLAGAIAIPLTKTSDSSSTIGVLVNHYRMDKLKDLFSGQLVLDLGGRVRYDNLSTAESVYLVNLQGDMVTSSTAEVTAESRIRIDTYPVQQARHFNQETNGVWDNHQGIPVAGVSIILLIDNFKYLLIAEKELAEAFKNIQNLKAQSYMLLTLTIIAILVVSWLLAYFITIPLHKLMSCIDVISTGQFDICVKDIKNRDEFGLLTIKFYNMTRNIKTMRDELINKNARLYELSIRDEMTGLYNHRHLIERGEYCVAEANRYGKSLSCLMIDIDHFKPINDNFGHPFGDFVLANVARLLETQLRSSDIISRYGGEEFAVIMPETNGADATIVAEKIRNKVAMHLFKRDGFEHRVTISIGVAEYDNYENNVMEMIARADKALYQSKDNGRNRVSISAPKIHQAEGII